MASEIIRIKMTNIQSWADNDQVIELSPDFFNVVKAKSETGKTVIFKVFYQMVFPNYYRYNGENNLIRAGCSKGISEYWLSDGTYIKFTMTHSDQEFEVKTAEGDVTVYPGTKFPQEIEDAFGLVIDYDNKFILNIFTKDNPYPFIQTPGEWNASTLNTVFVNQRIDNAKESIKEYLNIITQVSQRAQALLNYRRSLDKRLVYRDVDKMQHCEALGKMIADQYDVIDDIAKEVNTLNEAYDVINNLNDKVYNVIETHDIKALALTILEIQPVMKYLESNQEFIKMLPENVADISSIMQIKDYVTVLSSILKEVSSIVTHIKTLEISNTKLSEHRKERNTIYEVGTTYKQYIDILQEFYKQSKETEKKITGYVGILNQHKALVAQLKEVQAKIKICPTCKRPIAKEDATWVTQ